MNVERRAETMVSQRSDEGDWRYSITWAWQSIQSSRYALMMVVVVAVFAVILRDRYECCLMVGLGDYGSIASLVGLVISIYLMAVGTTVKKVIWHYRHLPDILRELDRAISDVNKLLVNGGAMRYSGGDVDRAAILTLGCMALLRRPNIPSYLIGPIVEVVEVMRGVRMRVAGLEEIQSAYLNMTNIYTKLTELYEEGPSV